MQSFLFSYIQKKQQQSYWSRWAGVVFSVLVSFLLGYHTVFAGVVYSQDNASVIVGTNFDEIYPAVSFVGSGYPSASAVLNYAFTIKLESGSASYVRFALYDTTVGNYCNFVNLNSTALASLDDYQFHTFILPSDDNNGLYGCVTGDTFFPVILFSAGGARMDSYTDSSGSLFGVISTDSISPGSVGVTSIYSVLPAGGTTVATSTSFEFGATGYITSADFSSSTVVSISFSPDAGNGCTQAAGVGFLLSSSPFSNCAGQTFTFPISSSGSFSVSTTTDMSQSYNYGNSQMVTTITNTSYDFSLWGLNIGGNVNSLVSTTTYFTVATTTGYDELLANVSSQVTGLVGSSSPDLSTCNPANWLTGSGSFTQCVTVLFVPTSGMFSPTISTLQSLMLVPPIGYVSRMLAIMNGSASTTVVLPAFSATLPSGFPGAGDNLTLDPWNKIVGSGSIVGTATSTLSGGATLVDLTLPYWNIVVLVGFIFAVLHDLIGLRGLIEGETQVRNTERS